MRTCVEEEVTYRKRITESDGEFFVHKHLLMTRFFPLLLVCLLFFSAALTADSSDSNVISLDSSNFDSVVDGSANVLVEFFAPWYFFFFLICVCRCGFVFGS